VDNTTYCRCEALIRVISMPKPIGALDSVRKAIADEQDVGYRARCRRYPRRVEKSRLRRRHTHAHEETKALNYEVETGWIL